MSFQSLYQNLQHECQLLDDLNQLLMDEKDVLIKNDYEKLEDLSEKKQKLTVAIEKNAESRVTLMKAIEDGKATITSLMATMPKEEANALKSLHSSYIEKMTCCDRLNKVNGQIITSNIHHRKDLIALLEGNKVEKVNMYSSTGELADGSGSSHHEKA